MKRSPLVAAIAASLVCFLLIGAYNVLAQSPAPGRPASGPNFAVIDVQSIFKRHIRFVEGMKAWQAEVQAADADAKREKDMINMAAQKLADLRAGTKEYKDEEQRITTLQSEFTLKIKRKKEELVEHKASLYRQVYGDMQQVVNEITAANNIGLVLQYDGEQINPEKPDDVLRVLGQVVFWHSPDRDITKIVLDALNRGQQMPPAAGPVGFLSPNQPRSAMPQAGYNR